MTTRLLKTFLAFAFPALTTLWGFLDLIPPENRDWPKIIVASILAGLAGNTAKWTSKQVDRAKEGE